MKEKWNKSEPPKDRWIEVQKELPKPLKRVYVIFEAKKYNGGVITKQTIAEYVPKMFIPEEEYMSDDCWGDGDYDEEKDVFYTPSGWYESNIESEINYKISYKVTHWMPLMEAPQKPEI